MTDPDRTQRILFDLHDRGLAPLEQRLRAGRPRGQARAEGGLLVSGPLYLALGYVLAKFGYTRKTLGDRTTSRAASTGPADATGDGIVDRPRPAPRSAR